MLQQAYLTPDFRKAGPPKADALPRRRESETAIAAPCGSRGRSQLLGAGTCLGLNCFPEAMEVLVVLCVQVGICKAVTSDNTFR